MSKNQITPLQPLAFQDPDSGVNLLQLTDFKAHSYHLYFTESGWWDGNAQMVVFSDRGGATNLYSYHFADRSLRQLTASAETDKFAHPTAAINHVRAEVYFFRNRMVMGLDLVTAEERVLLQVPDGFSPGLPSVTADGKHLFLIFTAEQSSGSRLPLQKIYQSHRSRWLENPHSRLLLFSLDTGESELLYEDDCWMTHPNASPTQPHLLLYCHEGPWAEVDNRMWIWNRLTGTRYPLRPRGASGERIGHEFWLADGETVGFHGSRAGEPARKIVGQIRYDNTQLKEDDFFNMAAPGHTHTVDGSRVVGDGGSCLRLWQWQGGKLLPSRLICRHNASTHAQVLHVHPRFSPDGRQVVFTSSAGGYGNIYLVDVPDYASLPPDPELPAVE